ncbi:type IV secretion system protein [Micromonospora sp. CA-246542]|uniref:type IV secretion system protein n=1 Tax=Micromonospora sp. CA-246542 TaxID=3239959 RepID=UPI003D8CECDD
MNAAACDPLNGQISGCTPGGIIDGAAANAWESVCRSFADAATTLLKTFADAFVAFPNLDLMSIDQPLAISRWLAMGIAALLLLLQVVRTVATRDGSPLAQGLVGAGKAVLAFLVTMVVANAALIAADEITRGIINRSLGGNDGLKAKLTVLFQIGSVTGSTGSLMLILALVGIALTLVLWFELLLRNAAIAVLLATSPIAAVGNMSETTKSWWSKLCGATIQLIILKPVIALVFAIGFGVLGDPTDPTRAKDVTTLLTGMLVLLMAAVAWPVIARFFTFATVQAAAGGGLAGMLGFAAGRANAGGPPSGVNPAQFSQASEARTLASAAGKSGAAGSAGMAGGAASALGAVAAPVAVAAAGVDLAQRAVNSLAGRMEQTAGHAGVHGANPHARPAGYSRYAGSWTGALTGTAGRSAAPTGTTGSTTAPAEAKPRIPAASGDTTGPAPAPAPSRTPERVSPLQTPAPATETHEMPRPPASAASSPVPPDHPTGAHASDPEPPPAPQDVPSASPTEEVDR